MKPTFLATGKQAGKRLSLCRPTQFQTHLHVSCGTPAKSVKLSPIPLTLIKASVLHLSSSSILSLTFWRAPPYEIPITSQRGHPGLHGFTGSLPPDGSVAPATEPTLPLHTRPQPCILGAERLGSCYCRRSGAPQRYVGGLLESTGLTQGIVARIFNVESMQINESGVASTSRGLVGDTIFAVIPNVKPIHTFIITIVFQSVRKTMFRNKQLLK
jgi:hypothetical protein